MSTTYTDSLKDTSPVAVSPPRKRSSCSCVAAGCGCIIVVLIIAGIVVAVMWPKIQTALSEFMNMAVEQQISPIVENKTEDMADDPRIKERLGEPIKVTRDESVPMNWLHPHFEFDVEGSKGKAKGVVDFESNQQTGRFEPTKVEVTFEDGTSIDLLEEPAEPDAAAPSDAAEPDESGTEAPSADTPSDAATKGAN